jgi:phenylacetate-coenzyme A ligase PaaK-like adenylate-forming protein
MQWSHKIFSVNENGFETTALEVFRFQYENNPIYRHYAEALHIDPAAVNSLAKIPFLPIDFFKSHRVQTSGFEPEAIFESSGTTGSVNSRHLVKDLSLYEESFTRGFELFYGSEKEYCILALLPSYLERKARLLTESCGSENKDSSLVYMVDRLIGLSGHPESGFYLHEYDKLFDVLNELEKQKQKTLLFGVTFALLDFAEKFSFPLKNTTIMETGGMKGRKEEMVRDEIHHILKRAFHVSSIHSEYGMTELLSQAYSKGDGIFYCPPWMKVLVRDEGDPFELRMPWTGKMASGSGAINVIDLANIHSCGFIATDDLGKMHPNGSFEVLGRMDNSDLRGCGLMTM